MRLYALLPLQGHTPTTTQIWDLGTVLLTGEGAVTSPTLGVMETANGTESKEAVDQLRSLELWGQRDGWGSAGCRNSVVGTGPPKAEHHWREQ